MTNRMKHEGACSIKGKDKNQRAFAICLKSDNNTVTSRSYFARLPKRISLLNLFLPLINR